MTRKPDKYIRGFTILELLIALAITGLLLTAIAAVFNASVMNYRTNEDIIRVTNNARQALSRITTQIRTGLVDPSDISDESKCKLLCADNSEITYRYDSGENKLYLLEHSSGSNYVLCDNVTAATFTKTLTDDGLDCKSVQISMTLVSGDTERKVSAAAVVRRNLK